MQTSNQSGQPLTSKQQQEFDKKVFEVSKHNTGVYNEIFDSNLEIDELVKPPMAFDPDRNQALYWAIR